MLTYNPYVYIALIMYFLSTVYGSRGFLAHKARKCRSLYNVVTTREPNRAKAILETGRIVCNSLYLDFLQYLNSSVKKLDTKTYQVNYRINDDDYSMLVKPLKGPKPIEKVIGRRGIDLTDQVLPFMGPRYDWHGCELQPAFFDSNILSFVLESGNKVNIVGNRTLLSLEEMNQSVATYNITNSHEYQ